MKCRILFSKFFPWRDKDDPPTKQMTTDFVKMMPGQEISYGLIKFGTVKSAEIRNSPKGKYVELEIEPVNDVDNTRSVSAPAIRRVS